MHPPPSWKSPIRVETTTLLTGPHYGRTHNGLHFLLIDKLVGALTRALGLGDISNGVEEWFWIVNRVATVEGNMNHFVRLISRILTLYLRYWSWVKASSKISSMVVSKTVCTNFRPSDQQNLLVLNMPRSTSLV
jgi:hypothetical protein